MYRTIIVFCGPTACERILTVVRRRPLVLKGIHDRSSCPPNWRSGHCNAGDVLSHVLLLSLLSGAFAANPTDRLPGPFTRSELRGKAHFHNGILRGVETLLQL